jgi:SulP family sulfate permease
MLAVAVVALVSLVTKTSSLEVARKASGDLDVEMRAHGVATLVAVPLGGIAGSMQMGTSRLLENSGGTRWAGVACALVLTAVGLLNLDLLSLIPLPIAAGLVFQLGWGFLVEAFSKSLVRREGLNLALAVVITAACVHFGYVVGVIGGVVCACLLFAASYARVGAVRQHLSRAQFAGNVSRSTEASHYLGEAGEAIQIYWLSGYIFFGSSEGVFERVRRDVRALPPGRVSHVILDFGMVPAADASATVSLAKLRNFCQKQGIALVFSGLAPDLRSALERDGFFIGKNAQAPFPDVTAALAWSEDALLAHSGLPALADDASADCVEAWLQQQLGTEARVADFLPYLERRSFGDRQVIYRQGEAADAIDLVASGRLAVDVSVDGAQALRLRRITTQTVVGEMGFFSHAARSATVTAEGPATVLTLTRASFERLRRERPDVASAFYEFLLRTLSDRIRLTEKMVLAMRL